MGMDAIRFVSGLGLETVEFRDESPADVGD